MGSDRAGWIDVGVEMSFEQGVDLGEIGVG